MKCFAGILLLIFMFSVNSSCNKASSTSSATVETIAQKDLINVSYGSDPAQKLDIYLPAGRVAANTKVLVFIHGGSWSGGDKSEFNTAITALRPLLKDYAFVNINYRLASSGGNKFPTQIIDVQSAIDFITSKSTEYQINTEKIALVGASAGAHLALLQAYKYNNNGHIKAVVDLFGPTDLMALYTSHPFPQASQQTLINFLGGSASGKSNLYAEASPINYVTAQSVPTQIFHGQLDYVVPVYQSKNLETKLQEANVKAELTVYPSEGHGWYGNSLLDTYTKVVAFLKQNVQ